MQRVGRDVGRRSGLSLIEVLLAVAILAVVSLPLVHFILSSKRGITISHQELVATNLATTVAKILKSLPYAEIPVGREATWIPQDRWGRETFELAAVSASEGKKPFDFQGIDPCPDGFRRFLSIEEQEIDPSVDCEARIKVIRVRVEWKRANRGPAQVGVTTCVASPR